MDGEVILWRLKFPGQLKAIHLILHQDFARQVCIIPQKQR